MIVGCVKVVFFTITVHLVFVLKSVTLNLFIMNKDVLTHMNDLRSMASACDNPNVIRGKIRETLKDYCMHSCIHPKKIHVIDRLTHMEKDILVPCGRCVHCRMQKQNDWFSRMFLHTKYCAKHAYFVTLTYQSFDNYDDIPVVLRDAYWRKDVFNEKHRECYSPCLLRHEHVQRFMKYLRKIHGADSISMFLGAEYGSMYGRPHFHLILWSNDPISRMDIRRAWSCRLPKSFRQRHKMLSQSRPIGRVDFNDLNTNGTIVADGINFGNDMRKCFMYVSKYVCKQYIDVESDFESRSRVCLFVNDLFNNAVTDEQLKAVFNLRIRRNVELFKSWADYYAEYLCNKYKIERTSCPADINPFIFVGNPILNREKLESYENSSFNYALHAQTLTDPSVLGILAEQWIKNVPLCVYFKVFKPYCLSSRAEGIGTKYLFDHISDYTQGKFNLPTYDGKGIIVPALFLRKTKEYIYRYVQNSCKIIGQHSPSNLVVSPYHFSRMFASTPVACPYPNYTSAVLTPDHPRLLESVQSLLRSSLAFRDYVDNAVCLAVVHNGNCYIEKYQYSRSLRAYVFWRSVPFKEFAEDVRQRYLLYSDYCKRLDELRVQSLIDYNSFYEDIVLFCDTFYEPCTNTQYNDIGELVAPDPYLFALSDAYDDYLAELRDARKKREKMNTNPLNE